MLFSVQDDEGCPILGIVIAMLAEMLLCFAEGLVWGVACHESLVELGHEFGGGFVVHLAEAHEEGVDTSVLETSLKTEDSIVAHLAEGGLAGREDGKLAVAEVHPGYIGSGDVTVSTCTFVTKVCTGKGEDALLHGFGKLTRTGFCIGHLALSEISSMCGNVQQVQFAVA